MGTPHIAAWAIHAVEFQSMFTPRSVLSTMKKSNLLRVKILPQSLHKVLKMPFVQTPIVWHMIAFFQLFQATFNPIPVSQGNKTITSFQAVAVAIPTYKADKVALLVVVHHLVVVVHLLVVVRLYLKYKGKN